MPEGNPNARLDNTNGRAYPLWVPVRNAHDIVSYLNVRRSTRYKATPTATYCNIYAYDYCKAMGVYLPRVWWTAGALEKIQRGEVVKAEYGKTIMEMNANALYAWLVTWGGAYGWERAAFDDAQSNVNMGAAGVICGGRKDPARPGHIAVIVPESVEHGRAMWHEGMCLAPLQCQAGALNKDYWHGAGWWSANIYKAVGTWYCFPKGEDLPQGTKREG
jgi:hypothetical protein